MSVLIDRLTHKKVGATEPGELIRLMIRSGYAIAVNLNDTGMEVMLGVLDWHEKSPPFYIKIDKSAPCLSYGKDWVIEVDPGPESYPDNRPYIDSPNVMMLSKEGPCLRFDKTNRSKLEAINFNPKDGSQNSASELSIPFRRWRIWMDAMDQKTRRASAIVDVLAPE